MTAAQTGDFRDWLLEVETSASGHDANGLPYFVWRESADNRLGLGRPRYCCVSVIDNELSFTFFDPSGDWRPTYAGEAFKVGAALVVAALSVLWWLEPRDPAPYHANMSAPPFAILVAMFLYSMFLGGLAMTIAYVVMTFVYWLRDGFKGDGRITHVPWRSLQSFVMMNAADTPAGAQEKLPRSSYGLGAAFDDGGQLVLTANAWNHQTMASYHRQLTALFITGRAEHLRRWAKTLADAQAGKDGVGSDPDDDVPSQL